MLLDSGVTVEAGLPDGLASKEKVTVVVRPEHAGIVATGASATVRGRLENIVYFGTDTHYHVKINGGGAFIVRRQYSRIGMAEPETGTEAGIAFEPGAAQVLRD